MCVWKLYNKMSERFIFKPACCFVLCAFYFFGEFFFLKENLKEHLARENWLLLFYACFYKLPKSD